MAIARHLFIDTRRRLLASLMATVYADGAIVDPKKLVEDVLFSSRQPKTVFSLVGLARKKSDTSLSTQVVTKL
jgi:hypothetical protein